MDIYEEITEFYRGVQAEKRVIGTSVFGRNLYAFRMGEGRPVCIAQYAIHGREWITARLALAQFRLGTGRGSAWFVPLVNPVGALLCQRGRESAPDPIAAAELLAVNGSEDFSLWKANGRAVDLNVNFPADWGRGKRNVRVPAGENYIGPRPLSEPETRALKAFTEEIRPDLTISYHTKGEEIYWYYGQSLTACARDKKLALALSASTGYPLCRAPGSTGGYKDWCIAALHIPAFTVEAGRDSLSHPLGDEAYAELEEKNLFSVRTLLETYAAGMR